ncbi:helix-turn-helix domain-containing protein [Hyphobacterium sp.]|jgi:AraC-like DNA-binding protein|uniref:helix-turn-helix domain-containing protein n=1 Tax=Hyphobacterium sp. TaxID=2004662 RepID=UPI003BAC1856
MAEASWILTWATLIQAILFAALLAHPRQSASFANRILLALLLVFAIEKSDQVFLASGAVLNHPQFAMIGNLFGALIAPLTYFHIRARIDPGTRLGWRQAWAFLPFAALVLYAIATYHRLDLAAQRALFETAAILNPVNTLIIPLAGDAVSLSFLGAAIWALIQHDKRARNWFSTIENRTLSGLRTVLALMAGIIAIHFLWTLTGSSGIGVALNLGHLLLINALTIGALTAQADTAEAAVAANTTGRSPTDEQAAVLARADALLREDRLYQDPDLTVARLARRLGLPQRQLSEAINQCAGVNFHTFVNTARIDAAKAALRHGPSQTVLDIAFANGFNSKSTFNEAFRKLTGQTPSQFRAQDGIDA